MAEYSVREFIEEVQQAAERQVSLKKQLSKRDSVPSKSDIADVEQRLKCRLPQILIELMISLEVSGVQIGHIVFGMGGFNFPLSLIEQNLNIDDPGFLTDRGLLSIGLEVNWASPLCIPREFEDSAEGPPLYVLDHETGNVVGPIYGDFLTFLQGQAYLCGVWTEDVSTVRPGIEQILGDTLHGPAADYWEEFFEVF
jgi:hypothetical protein